MSPFWAWMAASAVLGAVILFMLLRAFNEEITPLWLLGFVAVAASLVLTVLLAVSTVGEARDAGGRYAASGLKTWFDSLRSRIGPCCSDADGYALADVDWDTKDGHYRVRIPRWRFVPSAAAPSPPPGTEMTWVEVDDDALIKEPNRAGRTMVWPIWSNDAPTVRCFMPGSMI